MALTIEDKHSSPTSVLYDANKKTKAVSLPQDIILFQIITRVPAKSLIHFKCVSKQWNSFLMSDRFKQMHFCNLPKEPHLEGHNFLYFSKKAAGLFTINCESLPIKAPRRCSLPQFNANPPEYIDILTSFHGLVCLGIRKNNLYSDIILWNPLTTEYKMLSKPTNPDRMECYERYGRGYGLYYSSCEDDYKLLVVSYNHNGYIYSLKSDSWRKLNKKAPFQVGGFCWNPGFCLSENIYFMGRNISKFSFKFDTRDEMFHKITTPPEYNDYNYPHRAATTVHRGSIHSCVSYNIWDRRTDSWKSTCIELWKYNADGDFWSKVEGYHLMPNDDILELSPLNLMSNGKWLMRDHRHESNGGGRICQVDLKKKKYNKDTDDHKCKGNCHDEYKLYFSDVKVGHPAQVRYTETFVSPNQYIK